MEIEVFIERGQPMANVKLYFDKQFLRIDPRFPYTFSGENKRMLTLLKQKSACQATVFMVKDGSDTDTMNVSIEQYSNIFQLRTMPGQKIILF